MLVLFVISWIINEREEGLSGSDVEMRGDECNLYTHSFGLKSGV